MTGSIHKPNTITHHIPTALVGKGGVGLVMFHLARLGHEFSSTSDRSHVGDLWVNFGAAIEALEVKASTTGSWRVRPEQIRRVAWVVFVDVERGYCWLTRAAAVLAQSESKAGGKGPIALSWREVEGMAEAAWHKQAVRLCPLPEREAGPVKMRRDGTPAHKVVRRTLASGEVKEYRYPITGRAQIQQFYNTTNNAIYPSDLKE